MHRSVVSKSLLSKKTVKHVFVTGGVTSSLGKGIISASLGRLLQERGFKVTISKLDPYINVDPGTMTPYEHGECFITEDGAETDLDLGHYERFLGINTSKANNITAGRVYYDLIQKERRGDFLGKTVQVIPHVTDRIKEHLYELEAEGTYDVVIHEIGGCVGDIESQPFIEACRQARLELGVDNSVFIHLTLLPFLKATGELKTKPTQQSVKGLLSLGIQPDILVCRSVKKMPLDIRKKVALYCNVALSNVISAKDTRIIYEVLLQMAKEGLDARVLHKLKLEVAPPPAMEGWRQFLRAFKTTRETVTIALVGKYVALRDAYCSLQEALVHAGVPLSCRVEVHWLQAERMEKENAETLLSQAHGVLVASGFGSRGVEGKIKAAQTAREQSIPFFGICLGMQCALIEFARNVLGYKQAHSTEVLPQTEHPVVNLMEAQKSLSNLGGTMRLGAYACTLTEGTRAFAAYQSGHTQERHRHRYEFNNDYAVDFAKQGMVISGYNPDTQLAEVMELKEHPWFLCCQFHPEYKSVVHRPHPLFLGFLKAAIAYKLSRKKPSWTT